MTNNWVKTSILAVLFFADIARVQGATTELANTPLITSAAVTTLPNLLFVLDDSGSMDWTHMPDDNNDSGSTVTFNFGYYGYRSSQCNGIYYNPELAYQPPVKHDGTSYPNATFSNAWINGYKTSDGTINLGTKFRAEGDSSDKAAYYFLYTGAETTAAKKDYNSTTNNFFLECSSSKDASPGKDVFTLVTVGNSEQQNFANWYSYYRTRMLTMKTAAGRAFKAIDDHYRVGFLAINLDSSFLNVSTFDSTQKSAWYTKLYGSQPSGWTPLREALSNAGRLYAGKLNLSNVTVKDPVQYSCQQNFTILSTDGFWNSGAGFKLDGTTAVGNQDGAEIRPYFDGKKSITTRTTPSTTVERKQIVTEKTTTTPWSRYRYYLGNLGANSCSSTRRKYLRQSQVYSQSKVETTTSIVEVTTTTNRVVVTTDGVVTSDTTTPAGSPSTTTVSTSTTTVDSGTPDASTLWTDSGTPAAQGSCSANPTLPSPNPSNPTKGTSSTTTLGPTTTVISTLGPTPGNTTEQTTGSGGTSDTLADVAQYYYTTDLRTSALGNCTGVLGDDVCHNNVPAGGRDAASWQHMTTFTLGFGARGRMVFSPTYLIDTSGDFTDVKNGRTANPPTVCPWQTSGSGACNWPIPGITGTDGKIENIDDVWHAAVNGRGTYFSATDPSSLVTGLSNALAGASARLGSSAAAATSNPNVSSGDNYVFSSTFTTQDWDGELIRQQLDLTTGTLSDAVDWRAQSQLETKASRTIYTYDQSAFSSSHLKEFRWDNLTLQERSYFSESALSTLTQFCVSDATCLSAAAKSSAAGANLMNFLRGDRTNEGPTIEPNKYYHQRTHILGDIVSSEAVYVRGSLFQYTDAGYGDFITANAARQAMIYVGANDGMLHAFNGDTGAEEWGYIPALVLPNLFKLADKNYANLHSYYVDGSPVQSDVYFGGAWHTILVGGLNGGARGYYALDITEPLAPKALWEFSDTNLGFTYGNPVITKLKNGTWVALIASGYNNVTPGDGVGRLYVLNAATGAIIRQIATTTGNGTTPSGLARINAWVENGQIDNTALRVYGGDLLGNVWRFDINGDVGANGYDAQLLAKLKDAFGNQQPITTKPELGDVGGNTIVYVGTGRFLGLTDLSDTSPQSFYAIKDPLASTTTPSSAIFENPRTGGTFVRQTETEGTCPAGTPATICSTGQIVRTSSHNAVDLGSNNGWFVDFPQGGERANTDPSLVFGTLVFTTNKPDSSACTAGGYSFLYFLDYRTGGAVSSSTTGVVAKAIGNAFATRPTVVQLPDGSLRALVRMSDVSTVVADIPIGNGSMVTRRVSWREIVTD